VAARRRLRKQPGFANNLLADQASGGGEGVKPEHEMVLRECLRRQEALARAKRPPAWRRWEREPFDEQREHGPEYGCGEWFGPVEEYQRLRLLRAVRDLERGGLLMAWCRYGRRLSNIRLTAEGLKVARELRGRKRAVAEAAAAK
jgi:hypothetical protein